MNEASTGLEPSRALAMAMGGFRRPGHGLGGEDHQDGIHGRVVLGRLKGGHIALRVGIAQHVHGIAHTGRRGQLLTQSAVAVLRSSSATSIPAFSTASAAMVPGPPALVMIRTRFALGQRLHGKGGGIIEEGLEGIGPHHAGPFEGRAIGGIDPGQHPGVGGGRLQAGGGGSGFQDNHRFPAGGLLRRLDKIIAGG